MNSGGEPVKTAPVYSNMTQRDGARGDGASAETAWYICAYEPQGVRVHCVCGQRVHVFDLDGYEDCPECGRRYTYRIERKVTMSPLKEAPSH